MLPRTGPVPRASEPLATGSSECQRKAGALDGGAEGSRKTPRSGSKREIKALKKELQRKEKALAEAAALLVLRKKWEAYSYGEAFGYSSEDEEG